MFNQSRWSESELQYLRENWRRYSSNEVSAILNRSPKSVRTKAERLGIRLLKNKGAGSVQWTESEKQILKDNIRTSIKRIAELIPAHTILAIKAKRAKLKYFNKTLPKHTSAGYKITGYKKMQDGKRKMRYEHREVVESFIGRSLDNFEQVHHIDFNKQNNDIGNLFLCRDAEEHRTLHHSLNPLVSELLERGIIKFNREEKKYQLCHEK